jgi:hypothetical protein
MATARRFNCGRLREDDVISKFPHNLHLQQIERTMKLSDADPQEMLVFAAAVAAHAMLTNPNSDRVTVGALVTKAFEVAKEFLTQVEKL